MDWLRHDHGIDVYDAKKQNGKGLTNMTKAAELLGISPMSVLRLIREGIIPSRQVVESAPRIIDKKDLDTPIVKSAVAGIKKRTGIPLPESPAQEILDFQ